MGDIDTCAQTARQFIGSVLGLPGVARFGVNHHIARQTGEGRSQRFARAHMGQLGIEHLAGVGIDGHMADGVPAGHGGQGDTHHQHQPGVARAGRDDGGGRKLRQGLPIHVHDKSAPDGGQRQAW